MAGARAAGVPGRPLEPNNIQFSYDAKAKGAPFPLEGEGKQPNYPPLKTA